jgi:hypothetical protein
MTNCVASLISTLMVGMLLAGCWGGDATKGRAKVYKVSGTVTYVGNPVIGAVVTFSPQEKNQPAAVGRTDDAGEFSLTTYGGNDGAAAGEFKVLVMLTDSSPEPVPEAAHSPDGRNVGNAHSAQTSTKSKSLSLLPIKYSDIEQTPLTAKVDPKGNNHFTLELK